MTKNELITKLIGEIDSRIEEAFISDVCEFPILCDLDNSACVHCCDIFQIDKCDCIFIHLPSYKNYYSFDSDYNINKSYIISCLFRIREDLEDLYD